MRIIGYIKRKKQSMGRMLFYYMLALAFILVAVIVAGSFLFGPYSTAETQLSDILSLQMEMFEREVVSCHENLAMRSISLSEDVSETLERYFFKEKISFDSLENSQVHLNAVQDKCLDLLSSMILQTKCSGAFVLLDTTVNTSVEGADSSKSAVYIHRSIADATDDTFLLYRGDAQLGKAKGIMPHRKWRLECNKNDFPNYELLTGISADTPIEKAYFVSDVVVFPGTSEKVSLLEVPIRGRDGRIYGICGLEISSETFQLDYSQSSTLEQLVFVLSKQTGNDIDCNLSFTSGIANGYNLAPNGLLRLRAVGNGLYSFNGDKTSYIGLTRDISIACGEDNDHMLSVMVPKYSYDKMRTENIRQIAVFVLLLVFFAISCCGYLSKKYLAPILRRLESLKKTGANEEEQSYVEIDDLFVFLREKENALVSAQSKVDKLSYSRKTEIDPDDYEYFTDGIKTLTKSERKIFDLYVQGKTAQEILEITNIKERTLKYHNSNIYGKLGVHGKKELLRLAVLYERENGGMGDIK